MVAKVQQFNELKGYGWLLKDFRTRIWFHVRSWKSPNPPQPGMTVSYELAPSRKAGLPDQAINVTPLAASEILAAAKGSVGAL